MAKIKVDFTGVEESNGNGGSVLPGKYTALVESISVEEGKQAPYLKWVLKILTAPCAGLHINHLTTLAPQGLFNLRNTLEAIGVTVPKSVVMIDPDKFLGKHIGIEVAMKLTDGKEYPNIKGVYAVGAAQTAKGTTTTSVPTTTPVASAAQAEMDNEVTIELD